MISLSRRVRLSPALYLIPIAVCLGCHSALPPRPTLPVPVPRGPVGLLLEAPSDSVRIQVDSVIVLLSAGRASSYLRDAFKEYGVDGDSVLLRFIQGKVLTSGWADLGSMSAADFEAVHNPSRVMRLVAGLLVTGQGNVRIGSNGRSIRAIRIETVSDTGLGHTMYYRAFYSPGSALLFRVGDGESIAF